MPDPKKLIDFLTDSYNIGGVISLLALNGLFVLIHQHNLDYPDFYTKLYALLDYEVFHVKYCTRFFRLLDVFLTSTHLPSYLVAAFIKRVARLVLTAPPSGIIMAIPFICNLMKRHPSCQLLIHRAVKECKTSMAINTLFPACLSQWPLSVYCKVFVKYAHMLNDNPVKCTFVVTT
jgi:U3 small nucleolar RNA-associated protein 19